VTATVALAVALAAAAVFAAVQLLRPLPPLTFTAAAPLRILPGTPPRPAWPGPAEAVVGTPGAGTSPHTAETSRTRSPAWPRS